MVYQHPLALLLGLEGTALLRAFAGEYDRAFGEARIAEIRRLLDDPALQVEGVEAERVDTVDGYRIWSQTYDEPGNGAFPYEEPYVRTILDDLPVGVALDAACGTGRWSADLVARGHDVIGVDSSPDMLSHARARVPGADFRRGELHALPVGDATVDVAVCALALTHVPDLGPAFTEFARVLRPGGHLVVSDMHHQRVELGSVPHVYSADGEPGLLPAYRHLTGDYLTVALPLGLQVRSCAEPRIEAGEPSGPAEMGPWELWPYTLPALIPEAGRAVNENSPVTVIWHFQLSDR
jgi:SAM-dependent methyltransferase